MWREEEEEEAQLCECLHSTCMQESEKWQRCQRKSTHGTVEIKGWGRSPHRWITCGKAEMGKGNLWLKVRKDFEYTKAEKEQQLAGNGMAEIFKCGWEPKEGAGDCESRPERRNCEERKSKYKEEIDWGRFPACTCTVQTYFAPTLCFTQTGPVRFCILGIKELEKNGQETWGYLGLNFENGRALGRRPINVMQTCLKLSLPLIPRGAQSLSSNFSPGSCSPESNHNQFLH